MGEYDERLFAMLDRLNEVGLTVYPLLYHLEKLKRLPTMKRN